jgi:hypothetical protein
MKIHEHNMVSFDPISIYALGRYWNACERQVFEWDEEYELDITIKNGE